MFISVLELFKVGIGPSSSHTMGPMVAAFEFRKRLQEFLHTEKPHRLICTLKGSLALTGKGHSTDKAVLLGMHGFLPAELIDKDVQALFTQFASQNVLTLPENRCVNFELAKDLIFDKKETLAQHPNGLVFALIDNEDKVVLTETYFSIGGGFIKTLAEIDEIEAPLDMRHDKSIPYPFDTASRMMEMARASQQNVAEMKRQNEICHRSRKELNEGLDRIWSSMESCVNRGLATEGELPGGLHVKRRAKALVMQLQQDPKSATVNDWLSAYAMAVNEENAAGHMVVTAPTNGAAGVIPAVLYYYVHHENDDLERVRDFLLVAAAIGGLIKHKSSISGAEVGCQGEVGSASAMAAAALCAVRGGSAEQVENAAEIALEHHLGMTCDPVQGLVQVPCIERNAFGAIKAFTAASLALRGSGEHIMPLDACIAAMKQTGQEMSEKFKETALGGLAVSITEC